MMATSSDFVRQPVLLPTKSALTGGLHLGLKQSGWFLGRQGVMPFGFEVRLCRARSKIFVFSGLVNFFLYSSTSLKAVWLAPLTAVTISPAAYTY